MDAGEIDGLVNKCMGREDKMLRPAEVGRLATGDNGVGVVE